MILFGRLKLATIRVAPVAVAAVVVTTLASLTGCSSAVKTGPSFSPTDLTILVGGRPIERLALIDGQPIDPITFPEAKGGSGALTYSLTPDVPGLKFDPATRVWSGTPTGARTAARTHDLTYTATGADGTSASVQFTVTVRPTLWGTWRSVRTWRDWRDDEDRVVGRLDSGQTTAALAAPVRPFGTRAPWPVARAVGAERVHVGVEHLIVHVSGPQGLSRLRRAGS